MKCYATYSHDKLPYNHGTNMHHHGIVS